MTVVFSERYPADASSVPLARHDVIRALVGAGFSNRDLHSRVALALSEATGNVVRHAYPNGNRNAYMDIVVNESGGAIMIAVTDYGVGMNHTDNHTRLPSTGLGLPLIRAQTTSVGIHSDTSGTTLTLHFKSS
jgi:anti-sigma regulatory factor (Ser/Thr protein kinase)